MALLFYLAALVFALGLAYRLAIYARTPAPLKIPTTPAPTTQRGVVWRMFREVVFFESLFKGNLWTWAFGMAFHLGLALETVRHLRYFFSSVPEWVTLVQPFGLYGGMLMVVGLGGLWGRRILVPRIRYISTPSDHLMLVLLLTIGFSGLTMKYLVRPDILAVKEFILGLLRFDVQPFPAGFPVFIHLSMVALLLLIFPFSKLLHAPGVFFSPTRNQVDDSREHRHIVAWATSMESEKPHG
ncbi:MAG: nitrate reductase [Ferrovum sp.]|nr:nitrate reductase [Ferrovum sp.]NDU88031.1 nitrate reductase [Ferrovum sp.]